ncbi:MAG TPA: sugar ABC transporter substrate-binding protein [Chloroflexota bacterium]
MDPRDGLRESLSGRLSRRTLLRGGVGTGTGLLAAAVLAACGGASPVPTAPPPAAPAPTALAKGGAEAPKPAAPAATTAPLAAATTAPAAAATAAPAAQSAPAKGQVEIEIGSYFDAGPRFDFINKTLDKFHQDNPGVKTKFEPVPSAQYWDKMQVRLAGGTAPDVLIGSGSTFLNFAEKGAWGEVDTYLKSDKSFNLDDYYKQADIFGWQGKQYGLPFMQNVTIFLYNKKLFKEGGVDEPTDKWTWDTLLESAKKLTRPGQFGLRIDDGFEFNWLTFIWSNGGEYIAKDLTKTTLDMPETIEAFQWLVDLKIKHKISPPVGDTSLGQGDPWMTGRIAMQTAGTGGIGNWVAGIKDFEWDLFPVPGHPKTGRRVVSSNGNPYLLVKQSKYPDQAWLLVKHLAGPFTQGVIGETKIAMPTLIARATDPGSYLRTPPASMKLTDTNMKMSRDLQFHKNWLNWYNEITKQMKLAFSGEKTVAEAAKLANTEGDRIIRSS